MDCESIGCCPYCKSKSTHLLKTKTAFGNPIPDRYHVACQGCAAFGPLRKNEKEAIEDFNTVSLAMTTKRLNDVMNPPPVPAEKED